MHDIARGGIVEFPVSCGDHIDTLLNSGVKDVAFTAEVRVNGTRGEPGFFDDIRHGGVGVPLGGKTREGGVDNLASTCLFSGFGQTWHALRLYLSEEFALDKNRMDILCCDVINKMIIVFASGLYAG